MCVARKHLSGTPHKPAAHRRRHTFPRRIGAVLGCPRSGGRILVDYGCCRPAYDTRGSVGSLLYLPLAIPSAPWYNAVRIMGKCAGRYFRSLGSHYSTSFFLRQWIFPKNSVFNEKTAGRCGFSRAVRQFCSVIYQNSPRSCCSTSAKRSTSGFATAFRAMSASNCARVTHCASQVSPG